MTRVLVTGGAGFIGKHIVDKLLANDFDVGILDSLSGREWNIASVDMIPRVHRGDITDPEFVKPIVKEYDLIFHEAALVRTGASTKEIAMLHATNVDGTINLLNSAAESDNEGFVYASSASVYGETGHQRVKEDYLPNPLSPYGFSKLEGEKYCRFFGEAHGLRTVCLRYFNVYGPGQRAGTYGGVIPSFLQRIAAGEAPIICGSGSQTRDFVHVSDVVEANLLAMRSNTSPGSVFNICTGQATSISELATRLCLAMGRENVEPAYAPPRAMDIMYSHGDFTRAQKALGFVPKVGLEQGLRELVAAYLPTLPVAAQS